MLGTLKQRQKIIDICLKMNKNNLNTGSSGNASMKIDEGILITPSGIAYSQLKPEDIVFMDYNQHYYGELLPSSEWHFHLAIQKERPDIQTVLHGHSPWSMVVACGLQDIPAIHYMIGVAQTNIIKCSPYRPFGTKELSDVAIKALGNSYACLLGNHGIITVGKNFDQAIYILQEVEQLAKIYVLSKNIGGAHILSDSDMKYIHNRFKTYGKQLKDISQSDVDFILPKKGD